MVADVIVCGVLAGVVALLMMTSVGRFDNQVFIFGTDPAGHHASRIAMRQGVYSALPDASARIAVTESGEPSATKAIIVVNDAPHENERFGVIEAADRAGFQRTQADRKSTE